MLVASGGSVEVRLLARSATIFGTKLSAANLKQHLTPTPRLWVNLPPSRELAAKLTLHAPNSAVQSTSDLADAHYFLTGTLTPEGPAYAWFHKQEFDAAPRAQIANHSPGCSATSQYPVRSDWVPLTAANPTDDPAAALNKYASLLAKVHGWLQLADSPAGASTAASYKLVMLHATGQTPLPADQPAQQDDRLQLALQADRQITDRRWVYILDIDCHGKGAALPSQLRGKPVPQ